MAETNPAVMYDQQLPVSTPRQVADRLVESISVKDFGAIGDGNADDTAAFTAAITYAHSILGAVYIPNGTYKITSTLNLAGPNPNKHQLYGASLLGQSRQGVTLISYLTGTSPVLQCLGVGGSASNIHIADFTMTAHSYGSGTALCLNSAGFVCVERLLINNFNYGLWINTDSPQGFTELNSFRDLWVNYCNNGIRMEAGQGNGSFNATSFFHVCGNCGVDQIWLNLVSGFWYNFQMAFHIWTAGSVDGAAVAINVGSGMNAIQGFGSVQIESQDNGQPGQLTGSGAFHWTGSLDINGGEYGIADLTNSGTGISTIACSNYYKTSNFTNPLIPNASSTSPSVIRTSTYQNPNGQFPLIFSIRGPNVEAVGISSYNSGADGNGLWIMGVPFQGSIESSVPGFNLSAGGNYLRSYSPSCSLDINGSAPGQLLLTSTGRHAGRMGYLDDQQLTATGDTQHIVSASAFLSPWVLTLTTLVILAPNYIYKYLFLTSPNPGFSYGSIVQLANLEAYGGPAPSNFGVNGDGNFTFDIALPAGTAFRFMVHASGIGDY